MHLHSFIAAVGLVAASNALLLPPDLPLSDSDSITTLPVPTGVDADAVISQIPETRTLALKCPGCIRRGRNPKHQKIIPSHLKLDFTIESKEGAERLTLNGYELYPSPDPVANTLVAPVLSDVADRHMGVPPRFKGGPNRPQRIQPLGFGMQTQTVATDDDDDLNLINIEIQIIEVGNVFIEDIPNVQVKLIKTPSGKLAIGSIDTIDARPVDSEDKMQKTCSTMLCKWKTLFFEKLSHIFTFKGCGGSKAGTPYPHHNGEYDAGHHGHGSHPHHMDEKHPMGRIMMAFISHVILPVLVGIVAGITVGLLSVVIGSFIVFLWRTFFRRRSSSGSHRCRHARKAAKSENAVVDEEKSGLMENQEEAEAPPAYVESNVAPVDETKSDNVV